MKHFRHLTACAAITLLLFSMNQVATVSAQGRMSDKDIEALMKNLKEDTKKFRSVFNSAVGKSTIRKTTQEKDAKAAAEHLEKQTESMLNQFQSKKKADGLSSVLATSGQIDKVLTATPMGGETESQWSKVKTELKTLSQQFGVEAP
jgi:hypothetical protein